MRRCTGLLIGPLPSIVQGFDDVVLGELELARGERDLLDVRLDLLQPLGDRRLRALRCRDGHRLAAIALEHAFRFEQPVDLRYGHRIDRVLHREVADRRQLGAGRQLAARGHAPDLVGAAGRSARRSADSG